VNESSKAVFLSYASQDADAAKRICEALRAAGVEVWFDQSELRGGDAWDAKIRKQIKECALFVPVISQHTQERLEGYFRLEWHLAERRMQHMHEDAPFLLPVTIDGTKDADAKVPARFLEVQWMRLSGGEATPVFCERVQRLLSGGNMEAGRPRPAERAEGGASPERPEESRRKSAPTTRRPVWLWVVLALVAAFVAYFIFKPRRSPEEVAKLLDQAQTIAAKAQQMSGTTAPVSAPRSEARQLAEKARNLFDALDGTRDDFKLAEELIAQAKSKDATDAEVCAAEAQLHERFIQRVWDTSDARREAARVAAQRAARLDPQSFEVRFAQAGLLGNTGREGEEKERQLRALRGERPKDQRVLRALGTVLDRLDRLDEAAAIDDESAALPGGDPLALYNKSQAYWFAGRTTEAEAAIRASLAQKPFTGAMLMSVWYKIVLRGDLDGARAVLNQIDPAQLLEDRAAFFAFFVEYLARRPDAALARLQAVPRDWINDAWYRGPKGRLVGDALLQAGRLEAAAVEWRAALKLVEDRLVANPNDVVLLLNRVHLLVRLADREKATREFNILAQMQGFDLTGEKPVPFWATKIGIALGRHSEAIQQIRLGLKLPRHAVDYTAATLRLDPVFDPLRNEREFQQLLSEADEIERSAAPGKAPSSAAPVTVDDKSVAVLAFANLSDDKGNEYFSDGISEELLNVLAKVPGLKVTARTSSFFFKGKEVPIPEIARQLGVAYVVEGSVRKAGDKVRITAQLIKAADGFHVWSDTFTRELKDVFAVQDEIAGLIARNLSLKMDLGSARRAVNPEAHRLVLEGRYFWNLRTLDGFTRAEAAFTKAIELDPQFAQAYAGLADVRWTRAVFESYAGANLRPTADAVAATEKALALDPTLAEAYPAAGAVLHWSGRLGEAELKFKKAIALNANYALAHHWYSLVLEGQGRLDEALAEIEQAIQSDPFSVAALSTRYRYLLMAGRISEALAAYEKVEALRPGFFFGTGLRAQGLLAAGRRDEALAVAQSVVAYQGLEYRWISDASAVYVLRALGREAEAVAHVEKLLSRLPADSYLRGVALAALDRWDEAMPCLERTPPGLYSIYFWNPIWDRWRAEPSFGRLLAKLGCTKEYQTARETLARMRKEQEAKP